MPLTVKEFLDLEVVRRGRPEVLAASDNLEALVRWVHTSEVYDIGPLLKGGEVLLTTGLGLTGVNDDALRQYASDLAERGLAALCIEVGRTWAEVPSALSDAAAEAGLPLIALRGVVPFVEVTEVVHQLLVDKRVTDAVQAAEAADLLLEAVLKGKGITGILRVAKQLAGVDVRLVGTDGHELATTGTEPPEPDWSGGQHLPIELMGSHWGQIEAEAAADHAGVDAILVRAAKAIAVELTRTGDGRPAASSNRQTLLTDLVEGRAASESEIAARMKVVGFRAAPDHGFLGLACAVRTRNAWHVIRAKTAAVADEAFDINLVGGDDDDLLIAIAMPAITSDALRARLSDFAVKLGMELQQTMGSQLVAIAAGPLLDDLAGLGRSLAVAREGRRLAMRLGIRRVLLAQDLGVHRLLARLADDPDLAAFIDTEIGRLLDYDASHGQRLVETLQTFFDSDHSKALAARRLGIRRQSLYHRLEKIEELTGGSISDGYRRTALGLALLARHLRVSGLKGTDAIAQNSG